MKSMESHSNALIIWLIVFGVTLILVVGGAAYFLSAPSAPVVTTNGSAGATNGSGMAGNNSSRESGTKWQKGHYANLFYEFDYPDIFKITRETVISDHSVDANGKDQFGVTQVTLGGTKEASDGGYEITVRTRQNDGQTPAEQLIANEKDKFFSDAMHGPNDAFQMMNINGRGAYKEYVQGVIIIGIPTGNLIHELRITWVGTTGNSETANEYVSALTDSYLFK